MLSRMLPRAGAHARGERCWRDHILGPRASTYRMDDGLSGQPGAMFVFFSNRLGCFGSLLVSAALTLVLLLILNVI